MWGSCGYCCGMWLAAVEVIAGNAAPHPFAAPVSKPTRSFNSHALAVKIGLFADESKRISARNTTVGGEIETQAVGCFDAGGATEPIEGVYNQHLRRIRIPMSASAIDTQLRRIETLPAGVQGCDLIYIMCAGIDRQVHRSAAIGKPTVVEIGVGRARVNNVIGGYRGGFY